MGTLNEGTKYRELILEGSYLSPKSIESADDLNQFLKAQLSTLRVEKMCILLTDQNDRVLLWTDNTVTSSSHRHQVKMEYIDITRYISLFQPYKLYLAHNHPGGTLEASEADRHTTNRVKEICDYFNVEFKGHWLIAGEQTMMIPISSTEEES